MENKSILREEVVEMLLDLVQIPSVNPRMATGLGEGKIAEYLTNRLLALGLDPKVSEVHPGRPNVVVTVKGKPFGPHIVFEAHTDTVPPSLGQQRPFSPYVANDLVFGRGACDTKASIAAMFMALASVLKSDHRGATISLAFTMGEELGHDGAKHLLTSGFRADAAVIGEPTRLNVVTAHKGSLRWKIATLGKSAHSATPQEGCNAIIKMVEVIRALDRMAVKLQDYVHPKLGSATLNIGCIQGGLQVNIVPDQCVIDLDRRLLPGESWVGVRSEVEQFLSPIQEADSDLRIDIQPPYQELGAMETPHDTHIVSIAQEAVRSIVGPRETVGVPFGTDGAEFSRMGIPSIVLGPGSISEAHTKDEHVSILETFQAALIYRNIMLSY